MASTPRLIHGWLLMSVIDRQRALDHGHMKDGRSVFIFLPRLESVNVFTLPLTAHVALKLSVLQRKRAVTCTESAPPPPLMFYSAQVTVQTQTVEQLHYHR